ncbi:M1 family aminopeptidase [Effusibacillus dendaii]|uniref:Peptidase M1 membrane alanine aminopeptidase domain-containing protein n=1 Tax=Effusibacillus dendaii TaxID=2743772 RepID=A0A7I8DGD5_9BACL|nr:M1 family aminopeptidase [Effusibacillus dendaii]BCJ87650.1 hypothetical protein skT53_26350 [Effusibacillus dendaii]
MFSSKKQLFFYQLILSFFATAIILGIFLRPAQGWIAYLQSQWNHWQSSSLFVSNQAVTDAHVKYQIDADLDTANSLITGTAVVAIPSVPTDNLMFYLFPSTYKPIAIEQVQLNGKTVPFNANAYQLTIPLGGQKKSVQVKIHFSTPIPAAGTRLGETQGVWSLTYWYPILAVWQNGNWIPRPHPYPFGDPFLMDLADYQVRLKYPSHFKWYTSGTLVSAESQGNQSFSEWKADRIRNFALIGGTGWHETSWQTSEGVKVAVAVRNESNLQKLKTIVDNAVKTYTIRFGNDAYPSLSVLEMPTGTTFAHEYPNLALFSDDIWNWKNGEHWIAHEIAHAWWFSSVGTYKALNPWLDEGLADYSALLYTERTDGAAAYRQMIADDWALFRDGKSYAPNRYGTPVQVTGQPADQPYMNFTNETTYYYLMYLRPVLMYHDLRSVLGDQKFFNFLQQFYLKNRLRTVNRQNLEQALTDVDPNALPLLRLWLDTPNEQVIAQVRGRFEK